MREMTALTQAFTMPICQTSYELTEVSVQLNVTIFRVLFDSSMST